LSVLSGMSGTVIAETIYPCKRAWTYPILPKTKRWLFWPNVG